MTTPTERLPFVDEHTVFVDHPPSGVWGCLVLHLQESLRFPPDHLLARILTPDPPSGFAVAECSEPSRLRLVGRHRFSEYALEFDLHPQGTGTILRARTLAGFPGLLGTVYRTLVIGSGGHRILVRRMLRSVARAADTQEACRSA